MASAVYTSAAAGLEAGTLTFSGSVKVLLVTSSYTFSAAHDFLDDVTGELSGGGYARQTLTGIGVTPDNALKHDVYEADPAVFPAVAAAAGTPAGAIVFKDTGVAGTSPLYAFVELTPIVPNGTDLTLTWGSGAVMRAGYAGYFVPDLTAGSLDAAWTQDAGTWTQSGGELYTTALGGGGSVLTFDAGVSEGRVLVRMSTFGAGDSAVLARYQDITHYQMLAWGSDSNFIHYLNNGSYSALSGFNPTTRLTATWWGVGVGAANSAQGEIAGVATLAAVSYSSFTSATRWGLLLATTTAARVTGFSFKSLTATWTLPAHTLTGDVVALVFSLQSPAPGATEVELPDVVSVRVTPTDFALNPIDPLLFTLEMDGRALSWTATAVGVGGAYDLESGPGQAAMHPGAVHTFEASAETTGADVETASWSAEMRGEIDPFNYPVPVWVTTSSPIVLPTRVVVLARDTVLDLPARIIVLKALGFEDYLTLPVDVLVARMWEVMALPVSADVSILALYAGMSASVDVEGDIAFVAMPASTDVAGDVEQPALPVALDVGREEARIAMAVTGDVAILHLDTLPVSGDVGGQSSRLEVIADLVAEDLARILSD